jgi:biopolymer transport protein TolR
MGGVNLEGGGKKDLNVEVNLIPMIDLLSCLVSFLLITAVWTQMTKLDTSQKLDGGGAAGEKPPRINVTVHEGGYEVVLPEAEGACTLSKAGTRYDQKALKGLLERTKNTTPGNLVIGLAATDDLAFESIVEVMDVCAALGLKNISLGQLVGTLQGGPRCSGGG